MIHYQLRCAAGHEFDGWFQNSAGFERLSARHMVECPRCGGTEVARALMAPAITRGRGGKGRDEPEAQEQAPTPPAPPAPLPAVAVAPPHMPDHVRAMLQRMRAEVERHCDYVGTDFVEEARRIHRGESERTGIYGEASAEEVEELAEEGIDIARIPWVPPADG